MTGRMERVRTLLRTQRDLCSLSDLYGRSLSNGRNDISALKARGWVIESVWSAHDETGAHCHYRLVSEAPVHPVQLALRASA